MSNLFLRNSFFPVIRAGLGLQISETVPEQLDYQNLIEAAKKQAVLPIVREGLNALDLHGEGPDKVQKMCMNDIYLFVHRDSALKSIRKCFEQNGIDYILLKGSALRDLYPEPWMRTSCDIDVLVRGEELDSAVSVLQKETDFKYEKRSYHDVSMTLPNIRLELHFNIKEDVENIDGLLSKAWENTSRKENTHMYIFTPEYQIFHITAHMSYHFIHGGLGVRPYIDLWLLRHKTFYDESVVRKMCEQSGILKFYEKCCDLSAVWLEGKKHDAVTEAMEQYSVDGGVFGSKKNSSVAMQRNHKGIKYVFSRLFIKRQSLEILYPDLKKHRILLPYYHVKRWIDALLHKRKRIKEEISILKNTNEKDIQSISQLFDCVGL